MNQLFRRVPYYFFIFYTLHTLSAQARSQKQLCSLNPLTSIEESSLKLMIQDSVAYKQIVLNNPSNIAISVSRCEKTTAHIRASYILFNSILGKKCSINSMTFYLTIEDGKVKYQKIPFGSENVGPDHLKRSLIQLSLEKVARDISVKNFFVSNVFCQIEFIQSRTNPHWILQLRNKKKEYCFAQSSLNGDEVTIIKRLYAKSSHCL